MGQADWTLYSQEQAPLAIRGIAVVRGKCCSRPSGRGRDRRTSRRGYQRGARLALPHSDFPQPVARLRMGLIWAWPDVKAWAIETGRLS